MKRLAIGVLAMLAACGGSNGYSDSYSGSITETYTCSSSSPPSFILSGEVISFNVDNNGNAVMTIGSCPGDTLSGTASGNTVTINGQSTFTCNQTDAAGDTIAITSITGTLTQNGSGGGLSVALAESATIDGDTCSGVASGTLN